MGFEPGGDVLQGEFVIVDMKKAALSGRLSLACRVAGLLAPAPEDE
ncbi:hypothetical protein HYU90_01970 [Candidatus Collierbacteria bacterium]|nr:hypothetical protein [Candidatus Collierbacteria bacterium]